jgi:hypothetical protein
MSVHGIVSLTSGTTLQLLPQALTDANFGPECIQMGDNGLTLARVGVALRERDRERERECVCVCVRAFVHSCARKGERVSEQASERAKRATVPCIEAWASEH